MSPDKAAAEPNSATWLAQKMGIAIEKAKMCTPCPYPTTYVPEVGRFSREEYAELVLHFQDKVKALWEKVWFGLYQVRDANGPTPTHASQLRKLYTGAGMAELVKLSGNHQHGESMKSLLDLLCNALFEDQKKKQPAIETLRLYDGIALDNLQYVIVLLKDYLEQVDTLSGLYKFLHQNQVDRLPTKDHQAFISAEFHERAARMARAVCNLDAQMQELKTDMENEARDIYGCLLRVNSLLIKDEVLSS